MQIDATNQRVSESFFCAGKPLEVALSECSSSDGLECGKDDTRFEPNFNKNDLGLLPTKFASGRGDEIF